MHVSTSQQQKKAKQQMETKITRRRKIDQTRKDTIWNINTTTETNVTISPKKLNNDKNQQKQEQAQFWETVNHIKKNNDNKWQCAETNCNKTYATISPLLRHIAEKRPEKHLYSNKETKCPWCGKTYNALSSLLKHLKYAHKTQHGQ